MDRRAEDQPLRAELFSVAQLERHARSLAAWHEVSSVRRPGDWLLDRLAINEASLADANELLADAVRRGRQITPAAEWLLDNFHLIEEQIRTARKHLPPSYNRELPRLANVHTPGPRVYHLALELISHADGRVDDEGLRAFVAAYQEQQPLRLGELWAIPIMLRLALIENLRRVVRKVTAGRRERERAAHWVGKMIDVASVDPERVVLVLADLIDEGVPITDAFAAEFASRLQGNGPALVFPLAWLEQRLAERSETVEHVFELASESQAADQVSIGNSIGSLRYLVATDWRVFVEAMSVVEHTLRTDPAATYAAMDFGTRDRYRHAVEQIAKRSSHTEADVAATAIRLAREAGPGRTAHVGYFLADAGRPTLERAVRMRRSVRASVRAACRRHRFGFYAGSIVAATAVAATVALALAPIAAPTALIVVWMLALAIASSQLAVGVVQWVTSLVVHPVLLPRLDFSRGIPAAHQTMVAIPTLITGADELDDLVEALEVRFLANRDAHLSFALITDFRDAATETLPADGPVLARAVAAIEDLNRKYATTAGEGFFLFHRRRTWNPREQVWMGWERKRGKLEELNAALRGELSRFSTVVGPTERLSAVKYVIALDSDTQLPRDAARLLAATLAHPLNRPCYDEELRRVTAGYTILQPRVGVSMASTAQSRFARWFGGDPGIDPYTRAVSDLYQDVFAEGSFIGKGIYDVDSFQRALHERLPDNRILSHDLLEGAYARSGLVSDVLIVEDFPALHATDVSRRYRWMRGDWQLLGWLLRRVPSRAASMRNPISWLSQWKLLDNLRRSVVPIALLATLVIGWTRGAALAATAIVLAVLTVPALLTVASTLSRRAEDHPLVDHLREGLRAFARQLGREAFALACLPYDALLAVDAIARTLLRLVVTRRLLLQWRTMSDAHRHARVGVRGAYVTMLACVVIALGAAGALLALAPGALVVAAPVLALWLVAPALSAWLSGPVVPSPQRLAAADLAFLGTVARRTWRFFEASVTAEDHWLPPDNLQEDPPRGLAHRTSPTNIGLSLLANLTAHDFGYVGTGTLIERTTATLATLDRLPRYRGHFYNWYDTVSLEPLRPTYVSTVDSGNLTGHLLTLAAGLDELVDRPAVSVQVLDGLAATLSVIAVVVAPIADAANLVDTLQRRLASTERAPDAILALLRHLAIEAVVLERLVGDRGDEARWWVGALAAETTRATAELTAVLPWLALPAATDPAVRDRLVAPRTLRELADLRVPDTEPALHAAIAQGADRAAVRIAKLRALARRCRALSEVEWDFLYDRTRHLLAIGYNVLEHRLDASCYDLLASEARLASFIAIAQGKLPQEHWFSLGRQLTSSVGRPTLLSWSGSMFEYLMPLLVMPTYAGTLLDETYQAAVERQITYGRDRGVPWGVSESGYNKTDAQLNYQYRAFGVPGLGFKRGLADDLVVAPYASAMALMVAPHAACANLGRLAADGLLGPYGFYEAVDYTASRLPDGKTSVTIASYMAHHQGMALLALSYLLHERPMQRRFEAAPAFRATELLLQERIPRAHAIFPHATEVSSSATRAQVAELDLRVFSTPNTPSPEVHLLSNGDYHVAVSNAGGGYSRWRDLAVTRWHEDATRDAWGTFGYLRDLATGGFWSIAHQPTLATGSHYEAIFTQGRAEFRRVDADVETHVEIAISPEDDIELRRVTLTNRGSIRRVLELTSYAEVVLTQAAADAAHPAFSNLFVQTELVRERQAIVCTRRPRSGGERPPSMVHMMTVHGTADGEASYETSRAAFIGRGRTVADPAALHQHALTDSAGSVLDPIVAIRQRVVLEPDETARFHVVTGVAETRDGALGLLEKYGDRHVAERVFELSWTHSQVVQRRLDASNAEIRIYERLASSVIYAQPTLRAPTHLIARNRGTQAGLWAYSISGDLPIVLVRIADLANLALLRQVVQAHTYWRLKGLTTDLVVWNEDPSGYRQVLQDEILAVIGTLADSDLLDRPGGIFVRRSEQISEPDKGLIQTVARVILSDAAGTLAEQVDRLRPVEAPVALLVPRRPPPPAAAEPFVAIADRPDLVGFNGHGGFTPDGREYVITTTRDVRTPAPWVNVLANPWFGTVISESGSAYTWCENAHGHRLTTWANDAVSDPSGEVFYLRDEDDGRYWSPTPLPVPARAPYTTRHGFGYSVFEVTEHGIASKLSTYVAVDAPVKFMVIELHNRSGGPRRISLTGMFELVLGTHRAVNAPYVVTELDTRTTGLFARNAYNSEFADRVAFLDCSESDRTVSGDRLELLGRNGSTAQPAVMLRQRLSGRVGAALDPCLAMQTTVELADGETRHVSFMLGSGRDRADARTLVQRFHGIEQARHALEAVWALWNRTLGTINVQTPDPYLNFLANGWLVYQTLACRMWARSGFYQSGGAYGFRDQLQDSMALLHAEPSLLRDQIIRSASRQFPEGDVQHWWHPPLGRGVRTHISDDYLWLPFAVARYVSALGDTGVLDENVGFLDGRPVKVDEDSYYDLPVRSDQTASVYEHCRRAIQHGLKFGVHGLPLMGSGDWNDGMNLVGEHGKGESVWLAFFLYDVLVKFAPLAAARDDQAFAQRCTAEAARLRANIEEHAWDGAWYRRAYFDDGTPLGSASSPECQIDSLPQSWALLSGAGDPARVELGLDALDQRLVRDDLGVVQLFDPPFNTSDLKPGYIRGYVPGVRENGGQYTHAAVWAVMALASAGRVARAWEVFDLINPIRHGDSAEAIDVYKVEPYVVAADVYTNPQHAGRGGWTWYTGSAGWMYQLITESLLGIHLEVDHLRVAPRLPPGWTQFEIHYRFRETVYHIHVEDVGGGGGDQRVVTRVRCDGSDQADLRIPLVNDRAEHRVVVELGG